MSSEVRFETKVVGQNPRTHSEQVMPALVTPLDEVPSEFEEIVIDGEKLGISQLFAERFCRAASLVGRAAEAGAVMDCVAFGVVMGGGKFTPRVPEGGRSFIKTDQEIDFGEFQYIGETDVTKPLEPAALGVPYKRPGTTVDLYMPLHTIVKIDDESGLFVQKVGLGEIAIGDIGVSNAAFAAPVVGTIKRLKFTTPDGLPVMDYAEPGWMLQRPAWTFNSRADDPLNQ